MSTIPLVEANDLAVRMYKAGYAAGAEKSERERQIAERTADYWYLRAHYTEEQIVEWQLQAIDTAAEELWIELMEAGERLGEPVITAVKEAMNGKTATVAEMTERQQAWESRRQHEGASA